MYTRWTPKKIHELEDRLTHLEYYYEKWKRSLVREIFCVKRDLTIARNTSTMFNYNMSKCPYIAEDRQQYLETKKEDYKGIR